MEEFYSYPVFEEDPKLKRLLEDCENDEEREKVFIRYQVISAISMVTTFLVGVIICGLLSLFIG